jgi:hypothetical protein
LDEALHEEIDKVLTSHGAFIISLTKLIRRLLLSSEKYRKTIKNKEQYLKAFPKDVQAEALKNILDIRKFETECYT